MAAGSGKGEETTDFTSQALDQGRVCVHVHSSRRYKSTTIDLFLPTTLEPRRSTGLSLVSRLLERGTRRLPGIRELNEYTDWLYGAGYFSCVQRLGPYQALRLHFSCVDDRFLPHPEHLLTHGVRLMREALCDPHAPGGVFDAAWVRQEQLALRQSLAAIRSDRSAWARRRCLQIMCPNEPYRLGTEGDVEEIDLFDGQALRDLLHDHLQTSVAHVYVCGDISRTQAAELCSGLAWARQAGLSTPPMPAVRTGRQGGEVVENGDASQGRLVIGYRGGPTLEHGDYPAFLLLNLILGGDNYGRLYRRVREEAGLCYHISSHLEPSAGFLFVEAGIDASEKARVQDQIADELDSLANAGPGEEELVRARRLIAQRLDVMADYRDGLIHFDLQRRLAHASVKRADLKASLRSVDTGRLAAVARRLVRDTSYLLMPNPAAPAS